MWILWKLCCFQKSTEDPDRVSNSEKNPKCCFQKSTEDPDCVSNSENDPKLPDEIVTESCGRKIRAQDFQQHDPEICPINSRSFHQFATKYWVEYKGLLYNGTDIAEKKHMHSFYGYPWSLEGPIHPNLCEIAKRYFEEWKVENHWTTILEFKYHENGNLADYLWGECSMEKVLSWSERMKICLGTARGLRYLHEGCTRPIIHGNIRATNILLNEDLVPKIADMGSPKLFEGSKVGSFCFGETRGYLAPEFIKGNSKEHNEKVDVFSFGILMLELISGRKCIDETQPENQVFLKDWAETLQEKGKLIKLLAPQLHGKCCAYEVTKVIDLAILCIKYESHERPSMRKVLIKLLKNRRAVEESGKLQR